jgi:chaperonin cofactor prefoldin
VTQGGGINITADEQKMINEFSKRHTKLKEIQIELKAYADLREKVKDCVEELEMGLDDDTEPVK